MRRLGRGRVSACEIEPITEAETQRHTLEVLCGIVGFRPHTAFFARLRQDVEQSHMLRGGALPNLRFFEVIRGAWATSAKPVMGEG